MSVTSSGAQVSPDLANREKGAPGLKRYLVAALIGIGSLGLGGLGGLIAARHLGPGPFDWFAQLVLIGVGLAVGLLVGLVGVGLCLKQEECP